MKKMYLLTLLFTGSVFACTNIQIKANDGALIVGRTMEFAPDLQSRVMNSPRDKKFITTTKDGKPTMQWTSRYGYLFADFFMSGQPVDGMNEKGLSFGYLYLPGFTTYQTAPGIDMDKSLPYTSFGDWILGNFATVQEVESALKDITIFAQPQSMGSFHDAVLPVHAVITDKTGKSLVVEFVDKEIKTYRNPLGILTNAPTFDWHLTNLQNYVNLSPYAARVTVLNGITYSGTGQGSGLVGLPGDPTPPSRFIKAALFQQTAMPVEDALSAVNLAQHILNTVDIPYGTVRGVKDDASEANSMDKTQWTVYKDLKNNIFYFKSYNNQTTQFLDMNKIDFSSGAKQFALPMEQKAMLKDAMEDFLKVPVTE